MVSACFLRTAPDKHTHTHSLSRCYLKSHCAHKDKPQQPEHHTASDKVHSSKFATVEIEFTLKNIHTETVGVLVLNHACFEENIQCFYSVCEENPVSVDR